MAEQVSERACAAAQDGAILIHTNQITDVCLDKDCIEDLRVYLTEESQALLNASSGAKARSVELMQVSIDVEELGFRRGYYSVDLTFYYRVRGETGAGSRCAGELCGVAVFHKRVVLYGMESATKIFSSRVPRGCVGTAGQLPEAIVTVIDPMVLSSRVVETGAGGPRELTDIPEEVRDRLGQKLSTENCGRTLYVTVGQFSTVRLERDAQLTVPGGQYCIPGKACCAEAGCQEDPCDVFSRIDFPYGAFYPRRQESCTDAQKD